MKRICVVLTQWVCLLIAIVCPYVSLAQTINIFVSPNGDAVGNGQSTASPVNLDRAKAIARNNPQGPCIIWLANGTYKQVALDASDTRPAYAPLTYQAV